jgi:hypothetical protein
VNGEGNWSEKYREGRVARRPLGKTTNALHLVQEDQEMIWKKDGSSIEIRTQGELADGRPALDEIVADGASTVTV